MMCYRAFLLAVGFAVALPSQKLHPLSDEHIQEINSKQSMWKAERHFKIEEYDIFKTMANGVKRRNVRQVHEKIHDEGEEIPESFDSREAWPECADIIGLIRDQSFCGSCWAFASVEAMSDRICIHSNATKKVLVSAQDLVTCGNLGGCYGGRPESAWNLWRTEGIVTGGLYHHTEQGCQSYVLPPCDDDINDCSYYIDTPSCSKECDNTTLSYDGQKTYGKKWYSLSGEKQMQLELLKNGPVVAIMTIYDDFGNYKNGIYQSTSYYVEGLHAVKIIGWGVQNGVKYWTIANSQNERWGENGFFRIIRGEDEADIESDVTAGLPDFRRF